MFDRMLSASWGIWAAPHVDLAVLGALAALLHDTGEPSQSRRIDADRTLTTRIGQMFMPRQPKTHQFDQALPEEARRLLIRVRLILDHVDGDQSVQRRARIMMHEKISPHRLERKAILNVRQSSAHQVLHNRESSALQDAMRDRLTAHGWSRAETADDDLGRSAAGGVARAGFDRMVAEVCLGKVGAVAAREVSRFARRSKISEQFPNAKHFLHPPFIEIAAVHQRADLAVGDPALQHPEATIGMDVLDPSRS